MTDLKDRRRNALNLLCKQVETGKILSLDDIGEISDVLKAQGEELDKTPMVHLGVNMAVSTYGCFDGNPTLFIGPSNGVDVEGEYTEEELESIYSSGVLYVFHNAESVGNLMEQLKHMVDNALLEKLGL